MKTVSLLFLLFPFVSLAEFSNESSLGIVITSGNTKTQTQSAKTVSKYSWEKNKLQGDAAYLQQKQKGALSAKNWLLGLRYERELSGVWSLFAAQSLEADRFAGIRQRYNTDLGGKYFFAKREKDLIWSAEAGYRFTRERPTSGAGKTFHKARVYSEAEKYFAPTTSGKLWAEYVPNFTETRAWLLNSEASITSAVSSVFSIQTAFLLKYNNQPPSREAKKSDRIFSTSLVAKF